jgi:hypothetical protein
MMSNESPTAIKQDYIKKCHQAPTKAGDHHYSAGIDQNSTGQAAAQPSVGPDPRAGS